MVDLPEPTRRIEPVWLEPYPDALLEGIADLSPGPEARYDTKESLTLAFVISLQQLPPRQRAVLVLRNVLGFHAAEVAGMLESSEHSVNSALKRARATLDSRHSTEAREYAPPPQSKRERQLVQRFADAFENDDIDAVVALLTDDAKLTIRPSRSNTRVAKRSPPSFATAAAAVVELEPRERALEVKNGSRNAGSADRPLRPTPSEPGPTAHRVQLAADGYRPYIDAVENGLRRRARPCARSSTIYGRDPTAGSGDRRFREAPRFGQG